MGGRWGDSGVGHEFRLSEMLFELRPERSEGTSHAAI